jgi:hypothetical protein
LVLVVRHNLPELEMQVLTLYFHLQHLLEVVVEVELVLVLVMEQMEALVVVVLLELD